MTSNLRTVIKRAVLAAALALGGSGVVRAGDNSMNPFTGESYAAFRSLI